MKRVLIAVILLLIIFTMPVYGQEEEVSKVESGITLELLYKKEFGELMVGPEGFPPPEIKQILLDKDIPQEDKDWLLNSLRIEIARKERVLYTDDGRKIQLAEDMRMIYPSKNMKYILVYCLKENAEASKASRDELAATQKFREYCRRRAELMKTDSVGAEVLEDSVHYWGRREDSLRRYVKKTDHWATAEYTILETASGKTVRTVTGEVLGKVYDLYFPADIYISDDAKIVVVVTAHTDAMMFFKGIIFYDEKGNEKKNLKDFVLSSGRYDMSSDGELFCAIKGREVTAFDKNGNQLWQIHVKGGYPGTSPCIAISSRHKYVTVSLSDGYTTLLDNKGKIITDIKCTDYTPVFSPDEGYLFLASDKDTAYLIRTEDGKVLWKKWAKNLSLGNSISFEAERLLIKIGTTPPKSRLLNRDGTTLAELPGYGAVSPCGRIFKSTEGIYIIGGQNED